MYQRENGFGCSSLSMYLKERLLDLVASKPPVPSAL